VEPGADGGEVRRLAGGDVAQLQGLRREALLSHPFSFGSSVEQDRVLDDGQAASLVADPVRSAVFGAFLGAAPGAGMVGMVGVRRLDTAKARHRAHVWGMYVTPSARGKGLGRLLLAAAIDHARSWAGVVQVHLSVTAESPEAQALYERAGFRVWGRDPRSLFWEQRYVDELHLVLPLDAETAPPAGDQRLGSLDSEAQDS
jgi:RimJ/RimL family protein N-acetyltransferase